MFPGSPSVAPCRILASLGTNHNGDLELARRLIDAARWAGADGVIFQKRTVPWAAVRQVLDRPAPQYLALGPTYRKALERMELPVESYPLLFEQAKGFEILVAPYDVEAFHEMQGVPVAGWKVDAPLATHLPLLTRLGESGKPVVASVAGCTRREVEDLVKLLPKGATLLHELAQDPEQGIPVEDLVPLMALKEFGLPVGYADNCPNASGSLMAIALGATILEKPLTLDRTLPGPGHLRSLLPEEFKDWVGRVRELQILIRSGSLRNPDPAEMDLLDWSRPSIVAACPIPSGTRLRREMLALKPPFRALSPAFLTFLEGRRVLYDIPEDESLTLGMVEL